MAPAAEPTRAPTRRRSLARAGVLLALCLAFGAVVNFGVAWWCVRVERALSGSGTLAWTSIRNLPKKWTVDVPTEWPTPQLVVRTDSGWTCHTSFQGSTPSRPDEEVNVFLVESGWPLRCCWGAWGHFQRTRLGNSDTMLMLGYVEVPARMITYLGVDRLPIGIHPLPFIANTLLYAAIPFALWLAVGPLRRRRRRRAGRCTRCAYDRAGLPVDSVCPECGQAAPSNPRSGHTPPAFRP